MKTSTSLPAPSRQSLRPEAILRIGWRRRWQIAVPALVIAAAASWWIQRLPDRYRSEALLQVVPQPVAETFVRPTVPTRGDQRLQSITQQILSRTQLERIIRDFDLYAERRRTEPMQDIVDSMRARDIEIRPTKGDAFRLGFSADSADVAMRVVERLVSLFIVETSLDRATRAEGTDQFLEAQLDDARRRLIDNETRLADYRRRHNGELPAQLEANVQGVHNTQMQLQVLADSLNRDRDRQLLLERSLRDADLADPAEDGAAAGDTPARTSPGPLERAEAALRDMQATLTEQHPDVVAMRQTIAELRKQAQAASAGAAGSPAASAAERRRRGRLDGLRAELSAVQQQIAEKVAESDRLRRVLLGYQSRTQAAPMREAELAVLTRDYDTLQQTYRALLARKQESQIAANLERQQVDAHFKVLDPARLPEQPFAPRRPRLYAIAVFAACAIGLLIGGTVEWLDRGLRTHDDVRASLGLPVLAAIPVAPARGRGPRTAAGEATPGDPADRRLIVHRGADPVFVEQYRRLGAALHHAHVHEATRSVLVASAVAAEGKTLSATNLALMLSRFGKRVLLVDGDLRKPSVHKLLRIANGAGLSEILRQPGARMAAKILSPTLSVITGGRHDPDPVALLVSEAFGRLLAEAREQFDWIVVDTPPIVLFPDAGLIADRVDRCVMVVSAATTASPVAEKAVAAVGASRILGVVLNRAEPSEIAAGYGYGRYGDPDGSRRRSRFTWRRPVSV